MSALRSFPLEVPGVGIVQLDFRDVAAYGWTNSLLGEKQNEDGLLAFLKSHFSDQGVFWDVGANIGQITAALLKRHPLATYCAFEPNPDLAARLTAFFGSHKNITVHGIALSETDGTATLHLPQGDSSIASLSTQHVTSNASLTIKTMTGDSFLLQNPKLRPALIKIDVEGHESSVLRGCHRLIREVRPVIVFEHIFLPDAEMARAVPEGYKIRFLHDRDGQLMERLDRAISHNAVLLPV